MARSPRARVPKTSGQGVSRLTYQKSYDLGNRSTGGLADFRSRADTQDSPKPREYGKSELGSINVSYGDTLPIGGLSDLEAFAKTASPKGTKLGRIKDKVLK